MKANKLRVAIIGLGYVGLPLTTEFAKKQLIGDFDVQKKIIKELKSSIDKTLEITKQHLKDAKRLILTLGKKNFVVYDLKHIFPKK
jgi:UDP-N-acetyl-D-glucosamine/UDP-N-acetyl-D-galactosamine dehydrogenase